MPNEKPQVLLVIAGERNVRENVQHLLEDREFNVLTAEDCQTGLEVLKHEAVDLVLLDIRRSEMVGLDVLTEVRQQSSEMPIVVITGQGEHEKAEEAFRFGAWDAVCEPAKQKSLFLNTIENALAHDRLIRENRECRRIAREAEERNRALLENVGSDIAYFDIDYRIVMVSKQVLLRSGLNAKEIAGKSLFDLFPKHQAELFVKRIGQIVKDKKGGYFEDFVKLPDGNRWFLSSVQPVRDLQGEVIGVISIATDMTAHKEAEKTLQESEKKYRLIVENSIAPITHFSADGHILMMNAVGARNLGGKPEDFIGKTLSEIFPKDQADQLFYDIRQSLDSDAGHEIEHHFRFAGRDQWFQTHIQPLRDANGNITAYQSIGIDITKRKETEAALRESEEKYRLVLDNALNYIFYLSPDGRILMVNAIAAEAMGGKPEDFIGRSIFEFIPPEMFDYIKEMLRKIIESPEPVFKYENSFGDPGNEIWVQIQNRIVKDEKGDVVGIHSVCADITELKVAQEELKRHRDHLEELVSERTAALRKSNEELRQLRNLLANIVDSMPSVLVGVDLEGRVIQWNRGAFKETGISAEKAKGCKMEEVFPRLSGEMEKVREAIRDRLPKRDVKVAWKANGETRYLNVTVFPLITNAIEGAVIRADDVTERVRIEEMMIQSEKMLTVGGLAAGMAHEINNPLAAIIQNLQVMRNRVSGSLEKNRRAAESCGTRMEAIEAYMEARGIYSMIESVMEAGGRAVKIVQNMLNFSRKSGTRFAPHNLSKLLDEAVELASKDYNLKKKYDFRDIQIVREYDPATPEVPCEPSEIQQVLLNILRNGAEAMSETRGAGEPPCFILRIRPDGDMARLEVEDNGPGMDEEIRRRVFEPFFTTKDAGVGTGLGLSVSYFIVSDNHRGTISVDSVRGSGSTFIIRLPLQRQR